MTMKPDEGYRVHCIEILEAHVAAGQHCPQSHFLFAGMAAFAVQIGIIIEKQAEDMLRRQCGLLQK